KTGFAALCSPSLMSRPAREKRPEKWVVRRVQMSSPPNVAGSPDPPFFGMYEYAVARYLRACVLELNAMSKVAIPSGTTSSQLLQAVKLINAANIMILIFFILRILY